MDKFQYSAVVVIAQVVEIISLSLSPVAQKYDIKYKQFPLQAWFNS